MPKSKQTQNISAFLDMIATSELTLELMMKSDNGYNVIVGSTAKHPILFDSYADHPRRAIDFPELRIKSTAAGRYQILARWFDAYKARLELPDFSPESQDAIAIEQIKERGALPFIAAGNIKEAIRRCSNIWASLPGAGYGQHENQVSSLLAIYVKNGGSLKAIS